jgi:RNA polymerase sigma factor (sigma-70 family)
MEPQSVGQAVRFLRQFATPPDGGRLDAELIERFVAAQDEAAFAQLVERHGPLVLGVCRRVLRNLHDAEDAFQATFLVLARKARHIRQRHALAGWLYKVAYHLSVRLRASAERRSRAERQPAPPRDDRADDQMTWAELRQVLDDEFARLPEKYRAPLLLCCLAGHTRDEAAEQLGWTLGTLKMRLERGRQLLRERLDRRGLTVSATMLAVILAQQATATPVPAALVRGTGSASVMFARGTVPAALSARVVRLAGIGLSAGTTKAMLIGAAAVLIGLLGLAGGILGSSDTPGPTVEVAAANTVRLATISFANATEETGLGAILRQHSARYPEWAPTGATLLDIDGDGHLDLHLAGQAEDFAALGRNTGGRLAYVDPRPEIPRGVRQWGGLPFPGGQVRHAFDFNEDRRLDVAISWHNDGAALYHNAATGSAASFRRTRFVPPEFLDIRASALADVNRDGIVDFLTSDSGTTVTIHLGKGDGTFRPEPVEIDTGLRCAGAIPVDLDDDGRLELIARQSEFNVPARRKVLRNTGPMQWTDVTRLSRPHLHGSRSDHHLLQRRPRPIYTAGRRGPGSRTGQVRAARGVGRQVGRGGRGGSRQRRHRRHPHQRPLLPVRPAGDRRRGVRVRQRSLGPAGFRLRRRR